jgi:peptidase E
MNLERRQVIALGGGGFSSEPENLALDSYILQQAGKPNPKVCFVPTATGDAVRYIANFYRAYREVHCVPSHLPRAHPGSAHWREQDVIYVGGGNQEHARGLARMGIRHDP